MAFPRPQIALQRVRGHLAHLPQSRQASGLAGGLLLVVGAVLVATALMTIFWQDPVTAVFAQHDQKVLSAKLAAAEKAPVPESTLSLVQRAESDPERLAVLAGTSPRAAPPGTRWAGSHQADRGEFRVRVRDGQAEPEEGPGPLRPRPLPGLPGTVAIAGHRTTYSGPFRRMNGCGGATRSR